MIKKIALFISVLPLIVGCASTDKTNTVQVQAPTNTVDETSNLTEAAASVSRSLVNLAQVEQAAHPMTQLSPPPNPASYGMDVNASIDWSGPVEPLVQQLAQAVKYKVRILGVKPSIPILVTLSERNVPVADILRDAAFQCGQRAELVVLPDSKVIEIRYETI